MKKYILPLTILVSLASCQSEVEKLKETEDRLFQEYIEASKKQHHADSICIQLEKNWHGTGSIWKDSIYQHFNDERMLWMTIGTHKLQLSNQVADKRQRVELGLE